MAENSGSSDARGVAPEGGDEADAYGKLRVNSDERSVKWRFHRGADQLWRWQKLSADQAVLAQSSDAFATYIECVADAEAAGYRQLAPPTGLESAL